MKIHVFHPFQFFLQFQADCQAGLLPGDTKQCRVTDGLVALSEFRDLEDLKIGDEVEVYVENQEDRQGNLLISRKKARVVSAWNQIKDALENDVIIEGLVKRRTKGNN